MALQRHELLSDLLVHQAIRPQSLNGTTNTYNTANGGASIDSWSDGSSADMFRFEKGLLIMNVATVGGTNVVFSLRDDGSALTNANGDANSNEVFSCAAITAAGIYVAEFNFDHVFASTYSRVTGDSNAIHIQRYLSVRAVTTGGATLVSACLVLGKNLRGFPTNSTSTITWVSS